MSSLACLAMAIGCMRKEEKRRFKKEGLRLNEGRKREKLRDKWDLRNGKGR